MNIGFVRKKYTFHGGSEAFTTLLINKLLEKGYKIFIYAIKWDAKGASNPNLIFKKIPVLNMGSLLRDLTFVISSFFLLKKEKHLDLIQTHDKTLFQDIYRAGDGCHLTWLKIRWKYGNFLAKLAILFNPWHWLILWIERTIFLKKRYKKIIAISQMVKNNILENYQINPDDITVVYNGVDLERFNPENKAKYRYIIRKTYNISENDFVILFVGSGFKRKGLQYLIESLNHIHTPMTLLVAGKGKLETKNQNTVHKIIFCGAQREIEKYYAAADIFVFPTLYEPFGNVHLEAIASGLPVITTKNSGAAEIIKEGINGFILSSPENISELSDFILKLTNNDLRKKMSDNARKLAEKFDLDSFTTNMINIYDEIIKIKEKQ